MLEDAYASNVYFLLRCRFFHDIVVTGDERKSEREINVDEDFSVAVY